MLSDCDFKQVLEIFPYSIVILDNRFNIKHFNIRLINLTNYNNGDLIDKNIEILFDKKVKNTLMDALNSEIVDTRIIQNIIITKESKNIPVELDINKLSLNNETYYLITVRECMEQNMFQQELFKRQEELIAMTYELEQSNNLKELFTDIMRHDLLNPINVINGYTDLILKKHKSELNTKLIEYISQIEEGTKRAIELIENATKFSKLQSDQDMKFEELDLKEIVTEAINNLEPLANNASMEIINNININMTTKASPIIKEVFVNFISNAIKYAKDGKKIIVDANDNNEFWQIKIIDFGPGIENKDKKDVFLRFARREKGNIKGSGLGLAISKKVIELHNSEIYVEDNPEGGSIFIVNVRKK